MSTERQRKTYWHLGESRRVPSRYDIVTSKLLYYPEKGFSVRTPVVGWYERYVGQSPIPASCYSQFTDPGSKTYRQYVHTARDNEVALQGAFDAASALGENAAVSDEWHAFLVRLLSVLPFFVHGLQMHAAYCGQLAPEGKLVVTWAFRSANGMRRIQALSRRLAALSPELDWTTPGRDAWQEEPAWQPLRELLERLLTTYDFGEAWVASMLVIEPVFERLLFADLPRVARDARDILTAHVFQFLASDSAWHADCARALHACAWSSSDEARTAIACWVTKWWPLTERALTSMLSLWPVSKAEQQRLALEVRNERRNQWLDLGITGVVV